MSDLINNGTESQGKAIKSIYDDGTDALIQEAYRLLESERWKSAEVYCDGILEEDPENAKVCLCKLMARLHCKSREELGNLEKPFDGDPLYKTIVSFCSAELKNELRGYILAIKARNAENAEDSEKNKIYERASKNFENGTIKSLTQAANDFSSLEGWQDSRVRTEQCLNLIRKIKEKRKQTLPKKIGIAAVSVFTVCVIILIALILPKKDADKPVDNSNSHFVISYDGIVRYNENYSGGNIKDIVIPDNIGGIKVTAIADNAFYGNAEIESVSIPEGVVSIGSQAFRYCKNLEYVELPDSLTLIGDSAFRGCTSLESISIPSNVTVLNDSVFRGCSSLWDVTLPTGILRIEKNAFSDCNSLKRITLNTSLSSIGENAFEGCSDLESVVFNETTGWYRTYSSISWTNKTDGQLMTLTNASDNAEYLRSNGGFWYRLR